MVVQQRKFLEGEISSVLGKIRTAPELELLRVVANDTVERPRKQDRAIGTARLVALPDGVALGNRRKTKRKGEMTKKTVVCHQKPGPEARPGTYALLLCSSSDAEIGVGRLGKMRLQSGFYVYVGSGFGPGGVRARVNHHLHYSSRPHWHIDYLRPRANVEEVWLCHDRKRREHLWARVLSSVPGIMVPMAGFGSSDCSCPAHLFFFKSRTVRDQIVDALAAPGAYVAVLR